LNGNYTPLRSNVRLNLTCVVPTEDVEVVRPEQLDQQSSSGNLELPRFGGQI
jgi:hypothetical protein